MSSREGTHTERYALVHSVQLGDYSITSRHLGCQALLEVGEESVSFTQLVFKPGHKLALPLHAPLVVNEVLSRRPPSISALRPRLGLARTTARAEVERAPIRPGDESQSRAAGSSRCCELLDRRLELFGLHRLPRRNKPFHFRVATL
jgi:hypothetical protein